MPEPFTLHLGDCLEVMATFEPCSVDAVVTDPPYGIGFMGKEWDNFKPEVVNRKAELRGRQKGIPAGGRNGSRSRGRIAPAWEAGRYDLSTAGNHRFQFWCEAWATEALRVLKPGGYMVVFGGPRTYHRLACAIEDAGFEIRDSLLWLFGSGFPKSMDVSKAIDGSAGAFCPIEGPDPGAPWDGWGTALKPAYEPIVLARKPFGGTVAGNVLQYGTGALNIDATRIESSPEDQAITYRQVQNFNGKPRTSGFIYRIGGEDDRTTFDPSKGRWPANVMLDEAAAAQLDAMSGETIDGQAIGRNRGDERPMLVEGAPGRTLKVDVGYGGAGGASRFFYTSKASRAEREYGLDDLDAAHRLDGNRDPESLGSNNPRALRAGERRNDHPTVKPIDLMRWLCRMVTPPGGVILDPFCGSGSTGMAALDDVFRFIGIDLDPHYLEIARRRIARRHLFEAIPGPDLGQGMLSLGGPND